jgi:hypothetical protein
VVNMSDSETNPILIQSWNKNYFNGKEV